jgi:hypothetical protein
MAASQDYYNRRRGPDPRVRADPTEQQTSQSLKKRLVSLSRDGVSEIKKPFRPTERSAMDENP